MQAKPSKPVPFANLDRNMSRADWVESLVDDRRADGVFRVDPRIYTDPAIFDWEMQYIFERNWAFLGFESQLPRPHAFFTATIGRAPILVSRGQDSVIRAMINVCRHKGVKLCMENEGQSRAHVCPYHGWAYDSAGRNTHIKDREHGGYSKAFDQDDRDLVRVARLETYKGLIFASLSEDVPSLAEYLGDVRFFIDLAMDQGANGMEPIPGRSVFTYRGNWKHQFENGLDSYHLTSTHLSFMSVLRKRSAGQGSVENLQTDFSRSFDRPTNTFSFANGHSAVTVENDDFKRRPFYHRIDEVRARVGDEKAKWMLDTFNSLIFPNLQIAHNSALILRVIRPISVDQTEMTAYCLGAIGEETAERSIRLRSFEDFYNATGMATPDDLVLYERTQMGLSSGYPAWTQGFARGEANCIDGPSAVADKIGIKPVQSSAGTLRSGQEELFYAPYREWSRRMSAGLRAKGDDQ